MAVPRIAEFDVYGPFDVPLQTDRFLSAEVGETFWKKTSQLARLGGEFGCYVFALSTSGGGLQPLYVGKSTRSFEVECFDLHKLVVINEGLRKQSGRLKLFLVPYVHTGRGRINETAIDELEKLLIRHAHNVNPGGLLNKRGLTRLVIKVSGVLNSKTRGKPRQDAVQFKGMLGL